MLPFKVVLPPCLWLVGVCAMGLWMQGCERTQFLPPLTNDEAPVITLTSPRTNSTLARVNQRIQIRVFAVDDVGLDFFRVRREALGENGEVLEAAQLVEQTVGTSTFSFEFEEEVPDVENAPKLRYVFEVIDGQGTRASVSFVVSVLPEEAPPLFRIFGGENQRINSLQAQADVAFNFTSRTSFPAAATNQLDRDIEELTPSADESFAAQLRSPNNEAIGQDSVFVMTTAARFNFEEATYLSLLQAYISEPSPQPRTPPLRVGDLVIVRLTKAPQPQFAVMRIKEVINEAGSGNDYLLFDFKVSSR